MTCEYCNQEVEPADLDRFLSANGITLHQSCSHHWAVMIARRARAVSRRIRPSHSVLAAIYGEDTCNWPNEG